MRDKDRYKKKMTATAATTARKHPLNIEVRQVSPVALQDKHRHDVARTHTSTHADGSVQHVVVVVVRDERLRRTCDQSGALESSSSWVICQICQWWRHLSPKCFAIRKCNLIAHLAVNSHIIKHFSFPTQACTWTSIPTVLFSTPGKRFGPSRIHGISDASGQKYQDVRLGLVAFMQDTKCFPGCSDP